jgi:excisionase family DNA binding protein
MSDSPRLFDLTGSVAYFHQVGAQAATRNFVRELVVTGAIPHIKIGRKYYLSQKSIDEWIERSNRRAR